MLLWICLALLLTGGKLKKDPRHAAIVQELIVHRGFTQEEAISWRAMSFGGGKLS
jgi:hypothetical protein